MPNLSPSVEQRKIKLRELLRLLQDNQQQVIEALQTDFRKPVFETLLTEFAVVEAELKKILQSIDRWNAPKRVRSSLLNFPSSEAIYRQAYGRVLVISPWNYPFQLALAPVIGAIAMGNRVVLKPSELAPATSQLLHDLLTEIFPRDWVDVRLGDAQVAQVLLAQRWDYIFFTGSTKVGKLVAQAAAQHLTPYTLELGGKNPAVLLPDAPLELAVKRIVWGKLVNAGQTCIAPDYVLLPAEQVEDFRRAFIQTVREFYGENPKASDDFARIISDTHFERLRSYLQADTILVGGETDQKERYISPTLLRVNSLAHPVMQDEIFGPILAIVPYQNTAEIDAIIRTFERPLALYVFSQNRQNAEQIMNTFAFGGGCINDTLVHFVNPRLPFGGVGHSGQGAYHGAFTRDTFSHQKAIVYRGNWLDIPLRYPPYAGKWNRFKNLIKHFL